MPITFRCKKCQTKLRTSRKHIGKQIECPNCKLLQKVQAATDDVEVVSADPASHPQASGSPETTTQSPSTPPSSPANSSELPVAQPIAPVGTNPNAGTQSSSPPGASPPDSAMPSFIQPVPRPAQPVTGGGSSNPNVPAGADHSASLPESSTHHRPLQLDPEREAMRHAILNSLNQRLPQEAKHSEYHSAVMLVYLTLFGLPVAGLLLVAGLVVASMFLPGASCFVPLVLLMMVVAGLALMKPLFTRKAKQGQERILLREHEPFLFAFVDRIADIFDAPKPTEIHVDCDVNASASLAGGLFNPNKDKLVLTLGLPLVGGLTIKQLAGVIAHELGHFTQKSGSASSMTARNLINWFHRAVFQRDDTNAWLEQQVYHRGNSLAWLIQLLLLCARYILYGISLVVYLPVGHLARRMEFDADKFEAQLAGSEQFEATSIRITQIGFATRNARENLIRFMREKKLGDNLPKLIVDSVNKLSPEEKQEVLNELHNETGGLYDTHPPFHQRVANAREQHFPGIFHHEFPASVAFENFDLLCKGVTFDLYRTAFGHRFKPGEMQCMDDLMQQQARQEEDIESITDRLLGVFHVMRPFVIRSLSDSDEETDQSLLVRRLFKARERLGELSTQYKTANQEFDQLNQRLWQAEEAIAAFHFAQATNLPQVTALSAAYGSASRDRQAFLQRREELAKLMQPAETIQRRRIETAIDLLQCGALSDHPEARLLEDERSRIVPVTNAFSRLVEVAFHTRTQLVAQARVFDMLEREHINEAVIRKVFQQTASINDYIRRMRNDLDALPYPFTDRDNLKLGEYLSPPSMGNSYLGVLYDPVDYWAEAQEYIDDFFALYTRMVSRLASLVQLVEDHVRTR